MVAANKRDIESLLSLYNEKAVLIPTFSNRLLNNPNKIKKYFDKLMLLEELSVELHEKTLITQPINESLYVLSGFYCWRFEVDQELLCFEARFTYIIDIKLSSPIIHHHSSQIPRMI